MHLAQSQVIEAQKPHGVRVSRLHGSLEVVHDVGDAHQAALELPAVDRRCHPFLMPEQLAHQPGHDQYRGKHSADVEAQVVPAGLAEQSHCRGGQGHGQRQEDQRDHHRAAPRPLPIVVGVHRLDFEHDVGIPWLQW
ncbi:hypothetical protein D3C73_1336230 [compost metagenome]